MRSLDEDEGADRLVATVSTGPGHTVFFLQATERRRGCWRRRRGGRKKKEKAHGGEKLLKKLEGSQEVR